MTILKGCAGPSVEAVCANSSLGSVILLENVRFHVEEEEKGVDKDGNKFKAHAEAVKVFRSLFAKLDEPSAVMRSALHTVRTPRWWAASL